MSVRDDALARTRSADPGVAERRAPALLAKAGIPVEAIPADIDERAMRRRVRAGRQPGEIAALLAREKALAVSSHNARPLSCSAPIRRWRSATRLFTSPPTGRGAREQLRLLAGQTHELHSAVAVARDGTVLFADVASPGMTMRPISDDDHRTLSRRGRRPRSRRASAPTSSKGSASICSSASTATISPFSACRSCRCLHVLRGQGAARC